MNSIKFANPEEATKVSSEIPLARGVILVNKLFCTGCRRCELVCSVFNDGKCAPELARIQVLGTDVYKGSDFTPEPCLQCVDPPCLKACPKDAIEVDAENGTYARCINEEKCDGCKDYTVKKCIEACNRYFTPPRIKFDRDRNVALMCNLCGGDPQCVKNCLFGALTYHESEKGIMTGIGGGM